MSHSVLGPQFDEAARRLKGPEEGFTFDPRSGTFPTSGWAVGGAGGKERKKELGRVTGRTVGAYARMEAGSLQRPGAHVGGWEDAGKGVFDVATIEPSLHRAAGLMGIRGEDAVFNLGTHQTYWNQAKHPLKFEAIPPEYQRRRTVRIRRRTGK
jgi:hypothetical protein